MSEPLDPHALDEDYQRAKDYARELITLIKFADDHDHDADPGGHIIRGQIRQKVGDSTPLQVWLLIEVLARSVAATYEDLDDWSAAVIQAVAEEERP